MSNYIGIDFGMQNLKVCYYDERKNENIRVDLEGNQLSTSKISRNAVYYKENEEQVLQRYFFGAQEAEIARNDHDPDYVEYIKRELQKEHYTRSVCDGKYVFSALGIVTDIFERVYFKMNELGADLSADAILTVPVVFSEAQQGMLKFCAEHAGFNVQSIIIEPFAALFADEIFDECIDSADDDYVLMFDFGASTLDMCLINVKNEDDECSVKVISSAGLSVGGKDITDWLAVHLRDKCWDIINREIQLGRSLDEEYIYDKLFTMAESMKNELYDEEDNPESNMVLYGSKVFLNRYEVDKILDSHKIWDKIYNAILNMFEETDEFDSDDYSIVNKIVMTGGTSKIQYFRDKIEDMFDGAEMIGDPEEEDNIYCTVSSGAVNYAKIESTVDVTNSSPMAFGIDLGRGFEKALNRNSVYNIPGKRKQISYAWLEANDWRIKIYQTLEIVREYTDVTDDGILFSGFIQLNKNMYSDCDGDIVIQLRYTADGITIATASLSDIKNTIEDNLSLNLEVQYE